MNYKNVILIIKELYYFKKKYNLKNNKIKLN